MANGIVQVAPDGTGKKVDTSEITVGANTVERQRVVLADNATDTGVAAVSATLGLSVNVTNPTLAVTQSGAFTVQPVTFASAQPVTQSGNFTVQPVTFASAQPVTQSGKFSIGMADSASVDAFSRLRVANTTTIFDSSSQYGNKTIDWDGLAVGTGSISNVLASSSVRLSTGGTASGAKYTRQSRVYHRYQPGKSLLSLHTFVMGAATANLRRRIGYYDANDGIFLEQLSTGPSIVLRSSTSGSVVDTAVLQANWNVDKFDGTGVSGITLDLTKTQILVIDLQWLGVGRVRVGFDIAGTIMYAHQFLNANTTFTTVYMKTASLPCTQEIENTGVTAGTNTFDAICNSVISEGGFDQDRGYDFGASNGTTTIAVTTRRPVLTIRAATTGPNSVRNTGQIRPSHIHIRAITNSVFFEVVRNATTLTGAAYTARDATYSIAEFDVAATAISGGQLVDQGFADPMSTGGGTSGYTTFGDLGHLLPLVYTGLSNTQETLTIVCTSMTGTANISVSFSWAEFY